MIKDLIQCAAARDDFLTWLNWGNGALTIYSKENVAMIFKLEREPDADFQYLYHIAADKDSSISWNRNPVFCGVHDMESQALYLTEHLAAFLLDGEARVLMGHRNAYSTFYITAADRRKFEEAFGRYVDYTAEDITRITYGRNTIYEASPVQMEGVGEEIKMGGNSEYVSPEPDDGLTLGGMNWPTTL